MHEKESYEIFCIGTMRTIYSPFSKENNEADAARFAECVTKGEYA